MGAWGTNLYDNDIALDIKDDYIENLKQQLTDEEAIEKLLKDYEELFGTDQEYVFWLVLADSQWKTGRLTDFVKNKALECIKRRDGIEEWGENTSEAKRWLKTLNKIELEILSPMKGRKIFKKPEVFCTNPWQIGDYYALRLSTDYAKENDLYGKYIVFQKTGDRTCYSKELYSRVRFFNKVFNSLPCLDETESLKMLPFVYFEKDDENMFLNGTKEIDKEKFFFGLDYHMQITMMLLKKNQLPVKDLFYLGTGKVPEPILSQKKNDDNDWDKTGIDAIINCYLCWKDIIY